MHKTMQDRKVVNFLCNLHKIGKLFPSRFPNAKVSPLKVGYKRKLLLVIKYCIYSSQPALFCHDEKKYEWWVEYSSSSRGNNEFMGSGYSALHLRALICQGAPRGVHSGEAWKRRQNVFIILFTWLAIPQLAHRAKERGRSQRCDKIIIIYILMTL